MAVETISPAATRPPVDTRRVTGRRTIRYNTIDDLLADAERLAAGGHRELGNWSYGQILKHLAWSVNMGTDGPPFRLPWIVRTMARTFMKQRFLTKPMSPGFKLPQRAKKLLPPETSTAEGLAALRKAIERWKAIPERHDHPVLGKLTPAEWEQFALRHAEMHMSFVQPT